MAMNTNIIIAFFEISAALWYGEQPFWSYITAWFPIILMAKNALDYLC